jgi:YHS domain-containing protein
MRNSFWALVAAAAFAAMSVVIRVSADEGSPATPRGGAAKATVGEQITCAVDGMKMPFTAETPFTDYGGKTYYFCSESEKQTFLQNPERYTKH